MQALEPRRGRPRKFAEPSRGNAHAPRTHHRRARQGGRRHQSRHRARHRADSSFATPSAPGRACRGVGPLRAARGDPGRAIASVGPCPASNSSLCPTGALIAIERARTIADLELMLEDARRRAVVEGRPGDLQVGARSCVRRADRKLSRCCNAASSCWSPDQTRRASARL